MEYRVHATHFACIVLWATCGSCTLDTLAPNHKRDGGFRAVEAGFGQETIKDEVVTGFAEGDRSAFDVQESGAPSTPARANPARNIVLLLGDGMGVAQVNAGRMFKGGTLRADAMDGPVLLNTDSLSSVPDAGTLTITDSAAAGSAIGTGRRVYNGVLGLDRDAKPLKTVVEILSERGKSAGLITNSYVMDASPMAMATHATSRYAYTEIAAQLFGVVRPDIILGGWMADFGDNDAPMALLAIANGYQIVSTADALFSSSLPWPSKVLGLFRAESSPEVWPATSGLTPAGLRDSANKEPTVSEMTRYALERLSHNENGFFLFVEDEAIDSIGEGAAGYGETAAQLIPPEVGALDDALGVVLDWVRDHSSADDTLVVFTADHETGGYMLNGDDLSGAAYTTYSHTLSPVPLYAIGPGSAYIGRISHLTDVFRLMIGTLSPNVDTAADSDN